MTLLPGAASSPLPRPCKKQSMEMDARKLAPLIVAFAREMTTGEFSPRRTWRGLGPQPKRSAVSGQCGRARVEQGFGPKY